MIPQIGDFIAVTLVVAKIVKALNDSRGSKSEFFSILQTLSALSQALARAEQIWMDYQTSFDPSAFHDQQRLQNLNTIAIDMNGERINCVSLMSRFLVELSSYERAFLNPQANIAKQVTRKLMWIGEKDKIAAFEKRLDGHLKAFQLHLNSFYWLISRNDAADSRAVLDSIDHSTRQLTLESSQMQLKVSKTLERLDAVQTSMPTELGYCWGSEAPILLLDGLGRKTSLPLMFTATPDVFREILLIMHRGLPGYSKIQNGKYIVSDESNEGALVQLETWHRSFQPGKQIALSFLLRYPGRGNEKQCPRCCQFKTRPAVGGCITCISCDLTFRVEDRERTRRFWKDRKLRPKRPPRPADPSKQFKTSQVKRTENAQDSCAIDDEQDHHLLRVTYQRDVMRRGSAELPWKVTDDAFEKFLTLLPPLIRAAANGDVMELDDLLTDGADVNMHWEPPETLFRVDRTGWDFTGAPPIHFATYFGHESAVITLLCRGADIEGRDAAGTTAIHAAIWTGNERLFKALAKRGADMTAEDYDGWNVACYAATQGQERITRLLLANSEGDTHTLIKADTLRHLAKTGHPETVLTMLSDKPVVKPATMKFFLNQALLGAVDSGNEELVQSLLDRQADPTAADSSNSSAMHWAAWGGHAEIGNLRHDEEHERAPADNNGLPSPVDPELTSPKHECIMRLLLKLGADVNTRNDQGCAPLHWVSGAGSPAMVRFLLKNGADRSILDNGGRTALDRALGTGERNVIKLLRAESGDGYFQGGS